MTRTKSKSATLARARFPLGDEVYQITSMRNLTGVYLNRPVGQPQRIVRVGDWLTEAEAALFVTMEFDVTINKAQ